MLRGTTLLGACFRARLSCPVTGAPGGDWPLPHGWDGGTRALSAWDALSFFVLPHSVYRLWNKGIIQDFGEKNKTLLYFFVKFFHQSIFYSTQMFSCVLNFFDTHAFPIFSFDVNRLTYRFPSNQWRSDNLAKCQAHCFFRGYLVQHKEPL